MASNLFVKLLCVPETVTWFSDQLLNNVKNLIYIHT